MAANFTSFYFHKTWQFLYTNDRQFNPQLRRTFNVMHVKLFSMHLTFLVELHGYFAVCKMEMRFSFRNYGNGGGECEKVTRFWWWYSCKNQQMSWTRIEPVVRFLRVLLVLSTSVHLCTLNTNLRYAYTKFDLKGRSAGLDVYNKYSKIASSSKISLSFLRSFVMTVI